MSTSLQQADTTKGGEWLIKEGNPFTTFIPEDFTEEQRMIKDMSNQFVKTEILPLIDRIEKQEPGLVPSLLEKAGDYGLLSIAIPEEYGGLGKDFITATIVNEELGKTFSYAISFSVQTGIGMLPILYFGTEAQKQKYLPKMATGELKGAYGLTEPNSGSDALGAKTTATLSADGKYYLLNGQKCWISNGGFADVYIIFAKIDGENLPTGKAGFTGFIVEHDAEGFTRGAEEHKMGIKGSSTVQLYFQDCKVPVENVLGEMGKGHLIAFNILNIGRFKLGAAVTGGQKNIITDAVQYAIAREQFKIPIAKFGAIKHKLAEMAIQTWVSETAVYRTAKWIEHKEHELLSNGKPANEALPGAAEEYAIECAILKVFCSEVTDFCVDEGVQIHGGNGFSDEYSISRAYRDARINRIFEGTNEINRLLIVDMMLKRAMKGKLDLMTPAMAVSKELMSIPDFSNEEDEIPFSREKKYILNFKKALLLIAGAAIQKLMMKLDKEQEILMNLADMAIRIFAAESALLRLIKLTDAKGEAGTALQAAMVRTFIYDAADLINKAGKDALNSFAEGDELRMMHIGLKRFTKVEPLNTKETRRMIANQMIAEGRYCF